MINGWVFLLPITGIMLVSLIFIAPLWVSSPDLAEITKKFLYEAVPSLTCNPEPLEQLRYIMAIVLVPILFYWVYLANLGEYLKTTLGLRNTTLRILALVTQFVLVVVIGASLVYQENKVHSYFGEDQYIFASLAALLLLWMTCQNGVRRAIKSVAPLELPLDFPPGFSMFRWITHSPWVPVLVGIGVLLVELLACVFTDENLYRSHINVYSHLYFTRGEFASAVQGKVPLVSFWPQYQNLMPLLLAPWFKWVGLKTLPFTMTLCFISMTAVILLFAILCRWTKSSGWGLLLFLSFLAFSFYPKRPFDEVRGSTFIYYAAWPLRYAGPCWIAYLLGRYQQKPTDRFLFVLYLIAFWVMLNNLDFGFPALVACIAANLLNFDLFWRTPFQSIENKSSQVSRPLLTDIRKVMHHFLILVSSGCTALFVYLLFVRMLSGSFPDFHKILAFQHLFVISGFYMLPAPHFGLHWVVYGTFMAVLVVALAMRKSATGVLDSELRFRISILVFAGVFGSGAMMYYVGRSHPDVLTAIFAPWAFALMLLLWIWFEKVRKARIWEEKSLLILPGLGLLFFWALGMTELGHLPSVSEEWGRLSYQNPKVLQNWEEQVRFLKSMAQENEPVLILLYDADLLALDAHLKNVFPYAHPGSILIQEQVEDVLKAVQENGVLKVFRNHLENGRGELTEGLRKLGFELRKEWVGQDLKHIYFYERKAGF